jgi:4-hydroxy 2-oxovalerate aldolase
VLFSLHWYYGVHQSGFYFFTNQKRFDEFKTKLDLSKTIITNNIFTDLEVFAVLDFKKLVFIETTLVTNVAVVLINHLISLGIKEVEIAGLDGYKITFDNYSYEETNAIYDIQELITQNNLLSFSLKALSKKIDIKFITPTIFLKENKCSEKII